jgi:predicted protein tyrosine phosphatase
MRDVVQKKRILFVCRQNKVRSLTAEYLYRVREDLEVRSAGTAAFAKNQLTEELLAWADSIFIFDDGQLEAMRSRFGAKLNEKKIICLGLPDVFDYKSRNLVIKLTAKLEPYLGRPNAKRSRAIPAAQKTSPKTPFVSKLLAAVGVARQKPPAGE